MLPRKRSKPLHHHQQQQWPNEVDSLCLDNTPGSGEGESFLSDADLLHALDGHQQQHQKQPPPASKHHQKHRRNPQSPQGSSTPVKNDEEEEDREESTDDWLLLNAVEACEQSATATAPLGSLATSSTSTRHRPNTAEACRSTQSPHTPLSSETLASEDMLRFLPPQVFEFYASKGVTRLFPHQKRCLEALLDPRAYADGNMVLSMPTSSGKSLIAEVLALFTLFCTHKDALIVLPFVAIVQEKIQHLKPLAARAGFHVEEYAGPTGRFPPLSRRDGMRTVYIATIEKAYMLINSLLSISKLGRIGLLLVDELHYLSCGRRGALLEVLITLIKHSNRRRLRMVGMTATVGNIGELGRFFRGTTFVDSQRPVDLLQHVVFGGKVYRIPPAVMVDTQPRHASPPSKRGEQQVHLAVANTGTKPDVPVGKEAPIAKEEEDDEAEIVANNGNDSESDSGDLLDACTQPLAHNNGVDCSRISQKGQAQLSAPASPLLKQPPSPLKRQSSPKMVGQGVRAPPSLDQATTAARDWLAEIASVDVRHVFGPMVKKAKRSRDNTSKEALAFSLKDYPPALLTDKEKATLESLRARTAGATCSTPSSSATDKDCALGKRKKGQPVENPYRKFKQNASRNGDPPFSSREPHFQSARSVCSRDRQRNQRAGHQALLDDVLQLMADAAELGHCLVFSSSRNSCENLAKSYTSFLQQYQMKDATNLAKEKGQSRSNARPVPPTPPPPLAPATGSSDKSRQRMQLASMIRNETSGQMPHLCRVVASGVAFHHGGLTKDVRELIEEGYKKGLIRVLIATSTLAAGVNLPAKTVIIRSPFMGYKILSRADYLQMAGRAGRAGLSSNGLSFLCLGPRDLPHLMGIIKGPCENCESQLPLFPNIARQMLLSVAVTSSPCKKQCFYDFFAKTLLATQSLSAASELVDATLDVLVSLSFMRHDSDTNDWSITPVGRAAHASSFDCDMIKFIHEDIERFQRQAILSSDLHLLGLVTPYDMAGPATPNYGQMHTEFCKMLPDEQKVMGLLGADERVLVAYVSGNGKALGKGAPLSAIFATKAGRVVRAYHTLLLWSVVHKQMSIYDTARKFNVDAGKVQSLLQQAAIYASSIANFCKQIPELWRTGLLAEGLVKRLYFGVQQDILALMEIPFMKPWRAQTLVAAGFTTPHLVASAAPAEMAQRVEQISEKQCSALITAAKEVVRQEAKNLMDEAFTMLQDSTSTQASQAFKN